MPFSFFSFFSFLAFPILSSSSSSVFLPFPAFFFSNRAFFRSALFAFLSSDISLFFFPPLLPLPFLPPLPPFLSLAWSFPLPPLLPLFRAFPPFLPLPDFLFSLVIGLPSLSGFLLFQPS